MLARTASSSRPAHPRRVRHVADGHRGREHGRHQQRALGDRVEQERARQPAREESEDDQGAQRDALAVRRRATQQVADADAQVREHAGDVGGANDGTAVGGGHRVLQPAGERRHERGECGRSRQHDHGAEQHRRLQRQRHAVVAAEHQRVPLHDHAAQHRPAQEGGQHAGEVRGTGEIRIRQRGAQQGGVAGQVRQRLVIQAQDADHVDDPGDEGHRPCAAPDPRRQPGDHAAAPGAILAVVAQACERERPTARSERRRGAPAARPTRRPAYAGGFAGPRSSRRLTAGIVSAEVTGLRSRRAGAEKVDSDACSP